MLANLRNPALIAALLAVASVRSASAQAPIGTRAQGMAGAFVAVADDASAVYWNPAGIATGSFVSAVIDFGTVRADDLNSQVVESRKDKTALVALSATALGFAYYRVPTYAVAASTTAATGVSGREEVGHSVHAITTSVVGVSLLQSLSEHLVVGVTPKWMSGSNGVSSSRVFDVDAGAMFYASRIRLGVVAHNLTTPTFVTATAGKSGEEARLDREVRAGAAWGSGWTGMSRVIVAFDGDLTTRATPAGDRRDIAGGVETWWKQQRLGVRGGLRRSTIGEPREVFTAGISAGLTAGMLLDAHVERGRGDERSWSIGARMMF